MSIQSFRQQAIVVVYMHTSKTTGRSYIGTTTKTVDWRFKKHVWEAYAYKRKRSKFHRAIRKHGPTDWDSAELYRCISAEAGYDAEVNLIKDYNTFHEGYNTTPGGDAGPIMVGVENPMWGKTHTLEVRQRLSQGAKERYTGKSYEQRHGDKAAALRQKRSEDMKRIRKTRSGVGTANPNFNPEILTFRHTSGVTFTGTRQDFHTTHGVSRPNITAITTGKHMRQGWYV
jgi:GIY-YIG catalytic domain